jgi:hypothetical protein
MGKLSTSTLSALLDLTSDAVLMDDTIDTYEWLAEEPTVASPVITDALRALTTRGAAALNAVESV